MVNDLQLLVEAIRSVAEKWLDPEYALRVEAERALCKSEIRATPEAVAFAINQQMPQLSGSEPFERMQGRWQDRREKVGVVLRCDVPLGGLWEWFLVVLSGFEYVGYYESEPDILLRAFSDDVQKACPGLRSSFEQIQNINSGIDALIALGPHDDMLSQVKLSSQAAGLAHVLFRPVKFSVAVIDGKESKVELEDLAEDVLMHEGSGEANVRIIWAPEELNPDPYFESFAFFRGVYPAHERTPGSLQMKKAFLAAQDVPHAYGEGLEFLISRGEPSNLEPCHIRWVTYRALSDVHHWVQGNHEDIHVLVVRQKMHHQFTTTVPVLKPGKAHRLTVQEHIDASIILDFLASI